MKYFVSMGLLFAAVQLHAQTIILEKHDATVWGRDQIITGSAESIGTENGVLAVNGTEYPFILENGTFSAAVILGNGSNAIVAKIGEGESAIFSDTLTLTMGYTLRPEIYLYATVDGRDVTLHTEIIDNPSGSTLTFSWFEDESNGVQTGIGSATGGQTSFLLPEGVPLGEYYYSVEAEDTNGATFRARTFVTVEDDSIRVFDIKTDFAQWIDEAVIYEITPYIFVWEGKFHHITAKIPELAEFGITTIWLQPVFETYERGQGYGITNYFKVRPDLGTEQDLRTLIQTAKDHGLRVILDFVPNHSSIHHPYAQATVELGNMSHYYDYYQRSFDSAPYSQHYNMHPQGFVYYFWTDLPNFNYNNPEVRRMITEAGRYWIEEFGIDGYRIDAVWGVNARSPEFMREWRLALKRVKPEALLLGEDKATWPMVFDERFDVAFDWAPSEGWVSQWVWQTSYNPNANPTIFNNNNQNIRANLLRNSLTNNNNGYHPRARVLRFLENNDTFRFIATHDLARTKMTAALTFALHGVPLIYNGQEIGAASHPYNTSNIFSSGQSIRSLSQYGLFDYYRHLIHIRKTFPAFHGNNFSELSVSPNTTAFAFRRWSGDQNIFTVINMGSSNINAQIQLPTNELQLDSTQTYYLTDLISNEYYEGTPASLASFSTPVPAFTTRMFILADEIITTSVDKEEIANLPETFELTQNYPNPFNPSTSISFSLPRSGRVSLKVYDVIGREIGVLFDGEKTAGVHSVVFDAGEIASGMYFYRIEYDGTAVTKRMMLVK